MELYRVVLFAEKNFFFNFRYIIGFVVSLLNMSLEWSPNPVLNKRQNVCLHNDI